MDRDNRKKWPVARWGFQIHNDRATGRITKAREGCREGINRQENDAE